MFRNGESPCANDNLLDVLSSLSLVLKFNEKDVETFFILFCWADSDHTLFLQCMLTRRSQEAFSSLSASASSDYAKVKAVVLKSNELVPEANCQQFRNWKKMIKHMLSFPII